MAERPIAVVYGTAVKLYPCLMTFVVGHCFAGRPKAYPDFYSVHWEEDHVRVQGQGQVLVALNSSLNSLSCYRSNRCAASSSDAYLF